MVSMIAEDGILCQKEVSLSVWYGFSHLLLISEVLNILSKFRSHSKLSSFMLFVFSWNKLCIYYTLQLILKKKKIHRKCIFHIKKIYTKLLVSTRDISFLSIWKPFVWWQITSFLSTSKPIYSPFWSLRFELCIYKKSGEEENFDGFKQ